MEGLTSYLSSSDGGEEDPLKYVRSQWEGADKDGSGSLDQKEVIKLIHKLNIQAKTSAIKKLFAEVDADDSGELDFDEFCTLMGMLKRRGDLEIIFNSMTSSSDIGALGEGSFSTSGGGQEESKGTEEEEKSSEISVEQFSAFLSQIQGEEDADAMAQSVGSGTISYDAFMTFMTSNQNSGYNLQKRENVYQVFYYCFCSF